MKIQLTLAEQSTLHSLAFPPFGQLPTIAAFWLALYKARGIICPKNKIPVGTPTGVPGEYQIAFHAKALGPGAIAAGRAFRAFNEHKAQEYEQRMRAREGRAG
jgi:hypothetical protein